MRQSGLYMIQYQRRPLSYSYSNETAVQMRWLTRYDVLDICYQVAQGQLIVHDETAQLLSLATPNDALRSVTSEARSW